MKKMLVIALCALLVLIPLACAKNGGESQIPNPFTDCETVADAEKLAGFTITAPDSVFGDRTLSGIRAIEGQMIELIYQKDGDADTELRIRKGVGSSDISGDYTRYVMTSTEEFSGRTVTVKGNDDTVSLLTWSDGDYAYSISDATGAEKLAMTALIEDLK